MKPRRDLDDLDDSLFDREEAAEHRRARAEERELALERGVQLEEQDRILRARAKASFVGTSEAMILAEYRRHGVELRSGPGVALVSLQTLLSIGWRIEEVDGVRTLVAPPVLPKYVRRDRDSLPEKQTTDEGFGE
jgi:hypothetical protein